MTLVKVHMNVFVGDVSLLDVFFFLPLTDSSCARAAPGTPPASFPGTARSSAAPPWIRCYYNKLSERFRSANLPETSSLPRPPSLLADTVTWGASRGCFIFTWPLALPMHCGRCSLLVDFHFPADSCPFMKSQLEELLDLKLLWCFFLMSDII